MAKLNVPKGAGKQQEDAEGIQKQEPNRLCPGTREYLEDIRCPEQRETVCGNTAENALIPLLLSRTQKKRNCNAQPNKSLARVEPTVNTHELADALPVSSLCCLLKA